MRLVVLVLFVASCGSVVYIKDVTRTASDAVKHAELVEADKYAPYYWTRATQYLEKARERAAYADFQAANRYGKLATEAAQLAEQETVAAKKDPSKGPRKIAPAKEEPAPAKDEIAPAKETP